MLKRRIKRLERLLKRRRPEEALPPAREHEWTPEERVEGLRRVLEIGTRQDDPFPGLEGHAYLERFWDWWFDPATCEATKHYPEWVIGPLSRICGAPDDRRVGLMRGILAQHGVPDPFPDLKGAEYLSQFHDWQQTFACGGIKAGREIGEG